MATTQHHPVKIGLAYSIGLSVISVILTIIFYVTSAKTVLWTGYFVNLVLFLGVLFAQAQYMRQHPEGASVKELFGIGIRITLIVTVVLTIVSIILHFVIQANPGNAAMGGANDSMGNSPQGVDMPRNSGIFLISNVFFSNGIVGLLAALMGAMYFKRNQKTADHD
ncbi:MAG TPA: hypothetical protein VFS25_21585 [Chitinophaga sp.]|jgi:hypothetical protein|uniref:hypothetical protein n=1 Tax=Chitinophaga sp. TaxID=1869181 RepID=UPI002DBD27D3|nr:hypothetical protein [Chitinophaga sp.]HEU4555455.1 hypothetical protein [Chitinophaga sp.]